MHADSLDEPVVDQSLEPGPGHDVQIEIRLEHDRCSHIERQKAVQYSECAGEQVGNRLRAHRLSGEIADQGEHAADLLLIAAAHGLTRIIRTGSTYNRTNGHARIGGDSLRAE